MDNDLLNFEIKRKLFHLSSVVIPVVYMLTSKFTMCSILVFISVVTIYLDKSRHHNRQIRLVVDKLFGQILRRKEKNDSGALSGSSYMALGMLISCVFFSKGLAIASWIVLIVSDCFAALVGMKFGTPLMNGKSYAGGVAFFTSAIFVSIVSYFIIGYSTSFFVIIISSLLTAFAEFFSDQLGIDDNLSIPLTYCFATVIFGMF